MHLGLGSHKWDSRKADPFCRLRVPKYQKAFEAFFFATLLALYYGVLIERDPFHFTGMEAALIVFFIAFAVDEISSIRDAGTAFYVADFWSLWDLCIILIAIAFLIFSKYSGQVGPSAMLTSTCRNHRVGQGQ